MSYYDWWMVEIRIPAWNLALTILVSYVIGRVAFKIGKDHDVQR